VKNARYLALSILRSIYKGVFADAALDQGLRQAEVNDLDRRLATELVYGSVRRQRTLDALINQFSQKKVHQQPPDLRLILHLGLYQLRYLDHIPPSAVVNTTVELTKQQGFTGLAGFVNGLLRKYLRLAEQGQQGELTQPGADILQLPEDPIARLGILHSYPDWIVQIWAEQFGLAEAEQLCIALNQSPLIDLRVNVLQTSVAQVEAAMQGVGVAVSRIPFLPQGLRLVGHSGSIQNLPGFREGWWMVQDSSAQLVGHLLDPQLGEVVIDACAAPGGKTMHLAELMQDSGTVWACDRAASRLKRLQENCDRLQLKSIRICTGDSRSFPQFAQQADRVLLDAPCSGLGTLHRHADARWRQTPDSVQALTQLQAELLTQAATWVKPGGHLVYATCTLHPAENEQIVTAFLAENPRWQIEVPQMETIAPSLIHPTGWIKVLPHQHKMDGFFMVRLGQRE